MITTRQKILETVLISFCGPFASTFSSLVFSTSWLAGWSVYSARWHHLLKGSHFYIKSKMYIYKYVKEETKTIIH